MSALEDLSLVAGTGGPEVVRLPIDRVHPGESVRLGEVRPAHLETFVQLDGSWPAIVVTRSGHIVDGHYRYLAARKLRHAHVDCTFFDGTDAEAYVEAVRRNSSQGLALTLDERRTAAARILVLEPDWSDRRVASLCGLAHETVGRVRLRLCRGGEIRHLDRRKGRDGKYQRAARSSRARLPSDDAVAAMASVHPLPAPGLTVAADAAFSSTEPGRSFIDWFDGSAMVDEWAVHVESVPRSRVYEVADEARRRAAAWNEFAAAVAARASR
jgi:hypothetical protein